MKFIEDAFTLIHIRISHRRILGLKARHFVTVCLILFLLANTIQLASSTIPSLRIWSFIEAGTFIVLTTYTTLFWLKSWPKAGALLHKVTQDEHHLKRSHRNSD